MLAEALAGMVEDDPVVPGAIRLTARAAAALAEHEAWLESEALTLAGASGDASAHAFHRRLPMFRMRAPEREKLLLEARAAVAVSEMRVAEIQLAAVRAAQTVSDDDRPALARLIAHFWLLGASEDEDGD